MSKENEPVQGHVRPVFETLAPPNIPLRSDLELNPARWMHERLVRSINSFEEDLDQDQEIGARLVNFGSDTTIYIEHVGYWGPDIITFTGTSPDGNRVELLQHISQLSVLLIALEKVHENHAASDSDS